MKVSLVVVQILYCLRVIMASGGGHLDVPKDFQFGASTSAFQTEGGWNLDGKGESTWDRWTHINASYYGNGDNGDVATDSYHKHKDDVQLVKDIGLNHYRCSISWSRVLPNGTPDKVNHAGVQYYKNLIGDLVDRGVTPFVTMFHFDDVNTLYEKTGGWGNETMVEYFADYARFLFKEFGDKIKFWTTINELNTFCTYVAYRHETLNIEYTGRYKCMHNLLKAHARAYHIYDKEFRPTQKGKIGLSAHGYNHIPIHANDTESSKIAFDFDLGWVMHPIFSKKGDYPEVMKKRIAENSKVEGLTQSRLPQFSPEWIEYIKGASDYLGFDHYVSVMVEPAPKISGRWYDDTGVVMSNNSEWKFSTTGFPIVPEGIGHLLRRIRDAFGSAPVYILENGIADNAKFCDTERASYLYSYIKEVLLAVRDGCNVKTYATWSLLDNFEWFLGYAQRYGLVYVDYKDPARTRIPKLSSYWFRRVLKERKLRPYDESLLKDYEHQEHDYEHDGRCSSHSQKPIYKPIPKELLKACLRKIKKNKPKI